MSSTLTETVRTTEAYIGLGSNIEKPRERVRAGMKALEALPQTQVERCSSLYRSAPVGFQDQPDFINAVCRLITGLAPHELMRQMLEIERTHGRVRTGPAGGPRTLDLDLLLYGDRISNEPQLTLPHPRLTERAFVLLPLVEIAPELVIPGKGRAADLPAQCGGQRVERIER